MISVRWGRDVINLVTQAFIVERKGLFLDQKATCLGIKEIRIGEF
jgi:hypothetical protein